MAQRELNLTREYQTEKIMWSSQVKFLSCENPPEYLFTAAWEEAKALV